MVLIEVFRNCPPGGRCKLLSAYALEAAEKIEGVEIKLFDFPSEVAKKRGVRIAPALVIDGKIVAEDSTMKEIEEKLDPDELIKLIK